MIFEDNDYASYESLMKFVALFKPVKDIIRPGKPKKNACEQNYNELINLGNVEFSTETVSLVVPTFNFSDFQ